MGTMKKIGVGVAAAVGSAVAVSVGAKVVDKHRRKWFGNGYNAGHFTGFVDGAQTILGIAKDTADKARETSEMNSVILSKYHKLRDEYEELEDMYNELIGSDEDDE